LVDLCGLTLARLRHHPFKPHDSGSFDVADATSPAARARLCELLGQHGSLAGQTHALTRDPWRILFTKGRTSAIPFLSAPFTLVVWRDPIGPRSDAFVALETLRAYAARVGKHVVALAVGGEARKLAERAGYSSIWLGGEQFFELAHLSTRGRRGEKLRLAVNHARRSGLATREVRPDRDPAARAAVAGVERAWRNARPERDMRSFLRTDPMENAHLRRYFVAERDGRCEAFLVCAPVGPDGHYLQDLVRHPDAPRGACELVSLAALDTFRDEGRAFATMGIVPFLDETGARGPEAVPGAAGACIRHFDRTFRFSGLSRFRAKFPASRVEPIHAVAWPRVLLPRTAWDVIRVLSLTMSGLARAALAALLVAPTACAGYIFPRDPDVLGGDSARLPATDLAAMGGDRVKVAYVRVAAPGGGLNASVYYPVDRVRGTVPGVVFLPGAMIPAWEYESYAESLASRGMVVIVRAGYPLGTSHCGLAGDGQRLADFLVRDASVPESKLGVAGHSFGAKAAILAAASDGRFRAVVALDPDDSGEPSAVDLAVDTLQASLLLVGAEVSWKASSACAPREHNYERFFEHARAGTIEKVLLGADHVQLLDDATSPLYSICRVGTADSFRVRTAARRALVGFFLEQLTSTAAPGIEDPQVTTRVREHDAVPSASPHPPACR
jgi:dienelactone hydrolase